jgi:hypothetical protein
MRSAVLTVAPGQIGRPRETTTRQSAVKVCYQGFEHLRPSGILNFVQFDNRPCEQIVSDGSRWVLYRATEMLSAHVQR